MKLRRQHDEAVRVLLVKCSDVRYDRERDWPRAPPLVILTLSAAVKKFCRTPVKTQCVNIEMLSFDDQEEAAPIRAFRPHIVGLSAVTAEAGNAQRIAKLTGLNDLSDAFGAAGQWN